MSPRRRPGRRHDPFDPLDGPASTTLDLHGFRASEVREQLPLFLKSARKRHPRGLVHVITGKGRGSAGGPVLKTLVRTMLRNGELEVSEWREDSAGGGYLLRL